MSPEDDTPGLSRRRLLVLGAGGALAAGTGMLLPTRDGPRVDRRVLKVRPAVADRAEQQQAWNALLPVDTFGNRTAPQHHRLVLLDVEGAPTVAAAARLEDALRRIEASSTAGPAGLLLLVGWGPAWFAALDRHSPVPAPTAITPDEAPDLDTHAACLHLASDDPRALDAAERTVRGALRAPLRLAGVRTGFTGAGLLRDAGANGIPADQPPADAPLFMGFTSGTRRNQAREADIAIADGPWAGGTTMHVSVLSLALESWYGSLDEQQRAKRMFAPQLDLSQVRRPSGGIVPPGDVEGTARRHGLIGHAQAVGAARRDGRPLLLRRDFNGLDGHHPLVHFVALQRDIDDFVATRRAMAAARAVAADQRVGPHVNNGINEWITTRSRANYIVPVRSRRTCPGLPGWDA